MRLTLFILMSVSNFAFSQSLGVNLSNNTLGLNLKFDYTFNSHNDIFYNVGLKYHLNRNDYYIADRSIKGGGYAINPIQHFGISANRSTVFYRNDYGFNSYLFLGLDYSFMKTRCDFYNETQIKDSIGNTLYDLIKYESVNQHYLEENLGIGCNFPITKNTAFSLELGLSSIITYSPSSIYINNKSSNIGTGVWDFDYLWLISKIGVNYKLN